MASIREHVSPVVPIMGFDVNHWTWFSRCATCGSPRGLHSQSLMFHTAPDEASRRSAFQHQSSLEQQPGDQTRGARQQSANPPDRSRDALATVAPPRLRIRAEFGLKPPVHDAR
jgi:hypothetical protein